MRIGDTVEIRWDNNGGVYRVLIEEINAGGILGQWERIDSDRSNDYMTGRTTFPWHNIVSILPSAISLNAKHTIFLNKEYTAEVSKTGTKVGCQVFDNSKILEVAKAIREVSGSA